MFRPIKLVLIRHLVLECLYQTGTVSGHVFVRKDDQFLFFIPFSIGIWNNRIFLIFHFITSLVRILRTLTLQNLQGYISIKNGKLTINEKYGILTLELYYSFSK